MHTFVHCQCILLHVMHQFHCTIRPLYKSLQTTGNYFSLLFERILRGRVVLKCFAGLGTEGLKHHFKNYCYFTKVKQLEFFFSKSIHTLANLFSLPKTNSKNKIKIPYFPSWSKERAFYYHLGRGGGEGVIDVGMTGENQVTNSTLIACEDLMLNKGVVPFLWIISFTTSLGRQIPNNQL